MKKLFSRSTMRWTIILTVFIVVFAACSQGIAPPSDPKASCVETPADFDTWFQSGSVSLNGVVDPANSVTFSNTPNCDFYKWSERMFLWLTSPAPTAYGGGAHIFDSPAFFDVSPEDVNGDRHFLPHKLGMVRPFRLRAAQFGPHKLPIIFSRTGVMLEIARPVMSANGKQLILNAAGDSVEIERITLNENGKPVFFDPAGKVIERPRPFLPQAFRESQIHVVQKFMIGKKFILLDSGGNVAEVEQGQADGGVLLTQTGSLIYYATIVNDVYAYFLTGTKNGGITPAPSRFPTTQTELDKITAFAATKGVTFPDPNALTIEIKSSWVEAAGLPNLSSYITMEAIIPTYDKTNPNLWVPNGEKTVQMALVGMHVVGSTKGHPEMVWATFEHFMNTPNDAFSYMNTSNTTTNVARNTAGTWLFCASGSTGPFNEPHASFVSPNIESVNGFTIGPSNTIRSKAWGAASDVSPNPIDGSPAASNSEIISINNSVRSMLASGDIRKNYIMTGATWTIGGASPSGGNQVGTNRLANSTMETFQQGSNTLFAGSSNCFSCHPTNTTSVSHVFDAIKPLF